MTNEEKKPPAPVTYVAGWQDISTATTSGQRVDIWLEPRDALESGNAHRRINAYYERGDWWFWSNDGSRYVAASYHWRVTHWMPPPASPFLATTEGSTDG